MPPYRITIDRASPRLTHMVRGIVRSLMVRKTGTYSHINANMRAGMLEFELPDAYVSELRRDIDGKKIRHLSYELEQIKK